MGKCTKYLDALAQTFTDIRALTVMNMCQIWSKYLSANKKYGQKTVVTVEPGTGRSIYAHISANNSHFAIIIIIIILIITHGIMSECGTLCSRQGL
jgi:hypothetical protein